MIIVRPVCLGQWNNCQEWGKDFAGRMRGWVRVKMSYFNERERLSRLTVVVVDILKNVNAKGT